MKRVICFLLIICFAFLAVACTEKTVFVPSGETDQTEEGQPGNDETEPGGTDEPSHTDEPLELSAQMFDNARVELSGADGIGLILEKIPIAENVTMDQTYIARFCEDGTIEKITFEFTKLDASGGRTYVVTQEQIDPYPVNLYATEKFIFMAYSDYVSLIEYDDREPDNQFSPINENFVIDRKTGKVFSMGDLERFTVCGENIVRCSQYGVTGFVYYYLSVENGALIFTDLMPNKNIFVREVFEDAFGNVYVYNESVSKKEGNIVYVTDRVRIGEDGYAYLFRDTLSFNSIDEDTFSDNRYTVKRYGRDGFLQEEWNPVETVVRFPTDSYSEEGYVALLGSEIFVIGADGSGKICRWWGSQEGGEAGTYTAMAYLPFGTAYPLSPRMAVAIRDDGQVWYYDLLSSKNLTDYYGDDITVETFENQGFIMQGNSIVYKDGSVFVHVEDTQGTQVYKLELTAGANGLPAVTAVLHQENEYNAAVLIFLPLN